MQDLMDVLDRSLSDCESNEARLLATLEVARAAAAAERGFVLMEGKVKGDLKVIATHSIDAETIWTTAEVSHSIIRQVFEHGTSVLSDNASNDPRFSETNSVVLSGLRSVVCVPFKSGHQTSALLYLDNRFQEGVFGRDHLELLERIAGRVSSKLSLPRPTPRRSYRGPKTVQKRR